MTTADPRLGNPDWTDNWTLGQGPRFELMETATRRVFICQAEVTAAEVDAFEPPDGFSHALVGAARADMAFFARSLGATEDGPLETVELGGFHGPVDQVLIDTAHINGASQEVSTK